MLGDRFPFGIVKHEDLLGLHEITGVIKANELLLEIDGFKIWFGQIEHMVKHPSGESWAIDEAGQRQRYTVVGEKCLPHVINETSTPFVPISPIVVEIRGICSHSPNLRHMCERDMYYGVNERTGDLVFEAGTIWVSTTDYRWRVTDDIPSYYSRWHPTGYVAQWMKPDNSSRWQPSPGY